MAENLHQRLKNELQCSICLDTYTDPKMLLCFHVYCQHCLKKMMDQKKQKQLTLSCPQCRQETLVPGEVARLTSAFHLQRILEQLKKEDDRPEDGCASQQDKVIPHCSEHADEKLKLYCETCGKLVCFNCVIRDGKHYNHDYESLEKAFERYKKEIGSSQKLVEEQMAKVNKVLQEVEACRGKMNDQRATIEADTREDVRKTQLMSQLNRITYSKLESLKVQEKQLKNSQAKLTGCLDFMKKSMKIDSVHEVLEIKTSVLKQIRDLTVPFQADPIAGSTGTLAVCQATDILHFQGEPFTYNHTAE